MGKAERGRERAPEFKEIGEEVKDAEGTEVNVEDDAEVLEDGEVRTKCEFEGDDLVKREDEEGREGDGVELREVERDEEGVEVRSEVEKGDEKGSDSNPFHIAKDWSIARRYLKKKLIKIFH